MIKASPCASTRRPESWSTRNAFRTPPVAGAPGGPSTLHRSWQANISTRSVVATAPTFWKPVLISRWSPTTVWPAMTRISMPHPRSWVPSSSSAPTGRFTALRRHRPQVRIRGIADGELALPVCVHARQATPCRRPASAKTKSPPASEESRSVHAHVGCLNLNSRWHRVRLRT